MERDPFETAAEDAYRDADEPPVAKSSPPGSEPSLGRDGEVAPATARSSVPSSQRAAAPNRMETAGGAQRTDAPSGEGDEHVTDVPRSEPDPGNSPFGADPDGSRFREGGTFSNEPGWFEAGPKNAQLTYWFNLGGFVFGFLPIVGAAMSVLNRNKVGPELRTHYTYSLWTFGLAILYGLVVVVLTPPDLIGIVMLLLVGWYGWRNLRGLSRLGSGQPMPDPKSWTV